MHLSPYPQHNLRWLLFALSSAFFGLWLSGGCLPTAPCDTPKDCSGGSTCIQGRCEPTGDGHTQSDAAATEPDPKPCQEDKDCQEHELCHHDDKLCKPLPPTCAGGGDCRSGDTCLEGRCIRYCQFDDQCPQKQACAKTDANKPGQCVRVKPCEKTEDCDKGQSCNTCTRQCSPNLPKPEGQKCNEDFECTDLGGSDHAYCDKCITQCRKRLDLCKPCTKHEECGEKGDLCLPDLLNPQSGKKFCAKACDQGRCPAKYKCKTFKGDAYKSSPDQCIPSSNTCDTPCDCASNADCRSVGKICVGCQCVSGCEVDENCPYESQGPCGSQADCKHPNATCQGGICIVNRKCNQNQCRRPCEQDEHCKAPETCEQGFCKVKGACLQPRDCGDKEYCDTNTGLCAPGCQSASDCGTPPQKDKRCRWKCELNKCVEDCSCRSSALDCPAIRFCPTKGAQAKDPLAPCRKPTGPACKPCKLHADCGCKDGDDCLQKCTKKECQSDAECKGQPAGATVCYNGRCATKKACKKDADCPHGEKCENAFCAESCNNLCIQASMSTQRCAPGCNIRGDGSECPSRMSCTELLDPKVPQGAICKGSSKQCKSDDDCKTGDAQRCGEDGYCTSCSKGQVCRNLDPKDPLKLVCVPAPPTVCVAQEQACLDGGY